MFTFRADCRREKILRKKFVKKNYFWQEKLNKNKKECEQMKEWSKNLTWKVFASAFSTQETHPRQKFVFHKFE
jgi:hypothetical protein